MDWHARSLPLVAALLSAAVPGSAGEALRPLAGDVLASLRQSQDLRADLITRDLAARSLSLGLGVQGGVAPFAKTTDGFGRTHVRYHQLFRGVEVYNGTVLGHVDARGQVLAPHATIQAGIDLQPAKLLSEDLVREVVAKRLRLDATPWPMQVKTIVFPTKYQDGIKFKRDAGGRFVVDSVYSVGSRPKSDPYRWAYQVSATQAGRAGLETSVFIVDGLTGEILKAWDGVQHADAPSVGTGNSQYNGTVALATTQLTDSSNLFVLRDAVRATKPWPHLNELQVPDWGGIGCQTLCYDLKGPNAGTSGTSPFTSLTGTFGDGQAFDFLLDFPGNILTPRGQTAGVDAHYATQCTWDYYLNVLGRTGGIDGEGSSPINLVHVDDGYGDPLNNASWNPSWFTMSYGDGSPTGPLTSLDVAAHEMSHGVMSYTAGLQEATNAESGGLNEANSDIHAVMVKHYYWGADGKGSAVPDATTQAPGGQNTFDYLWTIGPQLSQDGVTPLRWLFKPSKDGISYDAWFDGIGLDDCHFSMGPANRAFFFLSQGASGDATKETHSEYLPGGMTGVGNTKAIKIWYNGMATKVTDTLANYHAIREAMVESATELYPGTGSSDSAEVAAVKNAFAAVNVGAPEGGKDPVTVVFPSIPGSLFSYSKILVLPSGVPVPLPSPVVSNATDPTVTWSTGGLSYIYSTGGKIVGNAYVAPMASNGASWPLKASSVQDPKAFAVNLVFAASMDCDSDSDTDACDLGAMALAYGMTNIYPASNIYGNDNGINDVCVWLLVEALNNAYNH